MSTFIVNSSLEDAGDVELQFPGDRFPVVAGPVLLTTGWRGGLFVQYAAANEPYTVEVSDGSNVAGFLLFQSEDYALSRPYGNGPWSPENYGSHQFLEGVGGQNVATMVNGGTRAYFRMFETVALTGGGVRAGGAITYNLNESLKISESGFLCNDSDANLIAAGVATPTVVGIVSAVPTTANGSRLCIDMKY